MPNAESAERVERSTSEGRGRGRRAKAEATRRRPPPAGTAEAGGREIHGHRGEAPVDGSWKLIQNVARPPEKREFELFDFYKDPLDQKDLAAGNPEVVQRLAKQLEQWRPMATAARLKPDDETTKGLSPEQLEALRALGYVR